MPPSLINLAICTGLLGWTLLLLFRAVRLRESGTVLLLIFSLALTALARIPFMAEVESNVDASTWLATALTVDQRGDPLWTLLTYSDSRPLTVLPLVVALAAGAPPTYIVAEIVGLLFALATVALCYRLLRFELPPSASLLGCWTLALFYATTGHGDHVAYNSEALAVFLVTLATYGALRFARRATHSPLFAGALGGVLGLFPYEKMQIVPAGFALAGFLLFTLVRRRAWAAVWALLAGGVAPTLLVSGYYAYRGEWAYFWNTYFWRYYYYSYSEEFSSMPIEVRFRPGRIVRFIFGNGWAAIYLAGLFAVVVVGWFGMRRNSRAQSPFTSAQVLGLSMLLLAITLYAVLQAGNNYHHYVLLLFAPLLHAASCVTARAPTPWRRYLVLLGLGAATVQATGNAWFRVPPESEHALPADQRITALLLKHSAPGEPIIVWGYADRFHVLADRPMGYRYTNTFYVYSPLNALEELDLAQFVQDLERNRAALFVDAMVPDISLLGKVAHRHEQIPQLDAYIRANYTLVAVTDGVRIYRRNPSISNRDDPVAAINSQ